MAILSGLDQACRDLHVSGAAATHSGMPPTWSRDGYNAAVLDKILKEKFPIVFFVARWTNYERSALKESLGKLIGELNVPGITLLIVCQVPDQQVDVPRALALGRAFPVFAYPKSAGLSVYRNSLQVFDQLETGGTRVDFVSLQDFFFQGTNSSRLEANGVPLYRDGDHLSTYGSLCLVPILKEAIVRTPGYQTLQMNEKAHREPSLGPPATPR